MRGIRGIVLVLFLLWFFVAWFVVGMEGMLTCWEVPVAFVAVIVGFAMWKFTHLLQNK
ncbi:hypothetical protein SAMN02745116_00775 [Pilibacter termitis]|uniref:Uncharacterized protein n=1 Tax=Pilibacter termitis TaxID=263852 RepID=A0A1T4LRA2_9ENTE|nr:hypothetical protein [Pilibacter termitis]SJZ57260.1 hypothetical protein SAMN02745116_00775 [Pilibacter termitis]